MVSFSIDFLKTSFVKESSLSNIVTDFIIPGLLESMSSIFCIIIEKDFSLGKS